VYLDVKNHFLLVIKHIRFNTSSTTTAVTESHEIRDGITQ